MRVVSRTDEASCLHERKHTMPSYITERMIRAERQADLDAMLVETDRVLFTMEAQLAGYDVPDAEMGSESELTF